MTIERLRGAGSHLLLAATALVCVFPIYWLFATSLRRPEDVTSLSPIPWPLSTANYLDAAQKVDIAGLIANTFFVAVLSAAGQLLIALLASYAFAIYTFPLQNLLYLAFVGVWLVPFQVTMLPNYILLNQLGLINTLIGVVLPTLCSAPVSIPPRSGVRPDFARRPAWPVQSPLTAPTRLTGVEEQVIWLAPG